MTTPEADFACGFLKACQAAGLSPDAADVAAAHTAALIDMHGIRKLAWAATNRRTKEATSVLGAGAETLLSGAGLLGVAGTLGIPYLGGRALGSGAGWAHNDADEAQLGTLSKAVAAREYRRRAQMLTARAAETSGSPLVGV